jgi:hypothetical protein
VDSYPSAQCHVVHLFLSFVLGCPLLAGRSLPELTVTPYERGCPAVMRMGPELVGNFFPT